LASHLQISSFILEDKASPTSPIPLPEKNSSDKTQQQKPKQPNSKMGKGLAQTFSPKKTHK
jgi:hypothetical protein